MTATRTPRPFARRQDNQIRFSLHSGQEPAWDSEARFTAVLAGTQGGKTVFGVLWLWREIKRCGPGDYLVVTPTYKLLQLKLLPEFLRFFGKTMRLGQYHKTDHVFTISPMGECRLFGAEQEERTRIVFGYAEDPETLESATAKAALLDEAGQKKFKLESWEAILRRLSIYMGRVLITTTIYNLGWLKRQVYDRWKAGDSDYQVVGFESIANPTFPREEYERARNSLPKWKFDMMYRGIFTRPAGLIYDAFNERRHKVKRFAIDPRWHRFIGIDFGGVNTAAVFYAQEPGSKRLYLYREYKAGGRTAAAHAAKMLEGEPRPTLVAGGSKSEGQWRDEFAAAGLTVQEPAVTDVEVGIDRVYGFHAADELFVFDDLEGYLEEKVTYSRVLDANGDPTEQIEDKHSFHFMDAERYILGWLAAPELEVEDVMTDPDQVGMFAI